MDLAPGTVIAGCRIEAVAGRGGMGVIYRATEVGLGRPVALKLIAPDRAADEGFRERFARESRLTASLDHPNVIPIYAAGEEDGRLYLVMRYVAGTDLQAALAARGRLDPARAVAIVRQVAAALDAAHATGLVHRDVKPANVLLGGEPGHEHVYLSDFGIVRAPAGDTKLTDSGDWVGTVDFMAPEQLQGHRTDARTDVYGLGGVLYTALTGAVPYPRETAPATMLAHMTEPPPRPSAHADLPVDLDGVVARAMAKEPQARFPSAGDLAAAATAAIGGDAQPVAERSVARGPAAADVAPPAHVDRAAPVGAPSPRPDAAAAPAAVADPAVAPTAHIDPAAAPTAHVDPAVAPTAHVDPAAAPTAHVDPAVAPTAHARPATAVAPPGPRPAPAAHPPRRGRRVAALAGVALLAALAVAAVGGVFDSEGPPGGALSGGEVRGVVGAFAHAYAREDITGLGRTLAPDVRRVAPGSVERGRRAVLAEYRRQFAANAVRGYRVSGLAVRAGGVGRAEGRYTVPRAGRGPITGRIVFGVTRVGGRPQIALIAAEPRA